MFNSIKQTMHSVKPEFQEINAGSMADIAFLLLIFFLVTTTLSTDLGIMRKLPPAIDVPPQPFKKRNVMEVWINRDNALMVRGEPLDIRNLRKKAKEFIANPEKADNLPEIDHIYVDKLGAVDVSKSHIISLMNDRGTRYSSYITVQNELTAAYSELRDELSKQIFNQNYDDLDMMHRKAIETVYPMHISEAEPK
jgi:biopolymer transport protein ExbD